jgi:hypothetical protein
MLTALIALATFGVVGCATNSHQHAGKSCDGSCCKSAEACAKCCGKDCASCCKK